MRKISKTAAMAKRINRLAMAELRHTAIVYHTGLTIKKAFAVDTRTLKPVGVNQYHFHAIEKIPQRWAMTLVAVATQPDGQRNYKVDALKLGEAYHHAGLVEYFNAEHAAMLNSINPKFKKDALWFASLELRELSESDIDALFEIGAAQ